MDLKKLLLAAMFIGTLPSFTEAQISLQPNVPSVGLIQKDQLWNVLLVNSSATNYDCRIELVLRDRATGQEVLTATTAQFVMAPGAKQLNPNVLSPIQYNYILAGGNMQMQAFLPAGSYTACYVLTSFGIKEADLAQECVQFDTEPLSPPMLIFPADSSVLEVEPNQFSWIPPTPDGMFDRLQYDVIITEISEGQNATAAIEENIPFYSEGNHFSGMLSYPQSAQKFVKEKWYAWQVVARDNRNYAGKSEVWVFKISNIKKQEPDALNYVLLKSTGNEPGIHHLNDDNLYIKYYSFDKAHNTKLRFKSSDGEMVQEIKQKIVYGDNLFKLKLNSSFKKGHSYIIELTDATGSKHTALFTIKK